MKTLRIVNYAVNGGGVGHLVRLIAINRWIRRYAAHAGVHAEIWFLTSSEADGMLFAEKFASFKMPSKSVVGDAGIDKLAYLALAKQWVWHSLGLLRPDLLIVDTFPRGSFGELLSALDLARKKAFVYRPTKEGFSAKPDFQAMLPLYDAIVVPEHHANVRVPEEARDRLRHVGPVMVRERAEMTARDEARKALGIADESFAVYVSGGGGGDASAERTILGAIEALHPHRDVHLVVGAGPLYRGRVRHGERITWLTNGAAAEWMNAFDAAVCACGYNSYHELMHAGVPTVFLPQEKIADEQDVRAQRAVDAGAALVAEPIDVLKLRGREKKPLVPKNCARVAAAEMLRLVLPASEVDAAEEAIGDALLESARALSLDVQPFVETMRFLGEGSSDLAVALLRRFVETHRVAAPIALKLFGLLSRKLAGTPRQRATAATEIGDALARFHDWAGAIALLKIFGTERELPAPAFAKELCSFLEGHEDLYAAIASLAAAQNAGAETNADTLRRARPQAPPIPPVQAERAKRVEARALRLGPAGRAQGERVVTSKRRA